MLIGLGPAGKLASNARGRGRHGLTGITIQLAKRRTECKHTHTNAGGNDCVVGG